MKHIGHNNQPIEVGQMVFNIESQVYGRVIKFYIPTASEEQTMVETRNGRLYHAPTRTWSPYKEGFDTIAGFHDEFLDRLVQATVDRGLRTLIRPIDDGELLNPIDDVELFNQYSKYLVDFSKNHKIPIQEAAEKSICKARLSYFNKFR